MKVISIILGIIAVLASVAPTWSAEVNFPTKPIHMWVGFAAGGSTDIGTRTVSAVAEKILGQPIIVENKPGGGGALCLGLLVSEKPDGYTLATTSDTPFTRSPHMIKVTYDPMKDFTPILRLGVERVGVWVKSDSPFKKFQDLIDFARKNPGQMTYGSPGAGTISQLAMEKVALQDKVKFQHVPFPGEAPSLSAVLGGHVMAGSSSALSGIPHVKAGTLRLLVLFAGVGMDQWPEIPTAKKLGYDFEMGPANVISAPKGLPQPVANKLVTAFSEAMMSSQYQKYARESELAYPTPFSGTDLQNWLQSQFNFYGPLVKELGFQKKE